MQKCGICILMPHHLLPTQERHQDVIILSILTHTSPPSVDVGPFNFTSPLPVDPQF